MNGLFYSASNEINVLMFIDNLNPMINYDIANIANELEIKDFRGVFMRDALPIKN